MDTQCETVQNNQINNQAILKEARIKAKEAKDQKEEKRAKENDIKEHVGHVELSGIPGTIVLLTAKAAKDHVKEEEEEEEDGIQIGMDLEEKEEETFGQQSGASGIYPTRMKTHKLNVDIKQQKKMNPKKKMI